MFLKMNEIKGVVVSTDQLTEEEYLFLQRKFNDNPIVFLIPYDEEEPYFLSENDFSIKEKWSNQFFGYEKIIRMIVERTQLPSNSLVFISKSIKRIKFVLSEPIGTILISNGNFDYEDIGHLPDIKLTNFKDLDKLSQKSGYFSEICSTILKNGHSYSNFGILLRFEMKRDEYTFDVIAGGRYFNTRHECFNCHQLSQRIKKSKFDQSQNEIFKSIFIPIIKLLSETISVDCVTRVPSRPNKKDRLKPIVQSICMETNLQDLSEGILCINEYPSHKKLSSTARFENVKGQFKVTANLTGKTIVIIDDVFTTGATIFECAKQLYDKGANRVIAVVLGVNQYSNEFTQHTLKCPLCEGNMYLRINSNNNTAFYGCENYSNHNNKCLNTENFMSGWKRIIEENSIKPQNGDNENECLF
jgi:ssDNA-binding Zn-finger/Zn-ribbon topoisomerase 1